MIDAKRNRSRMLRVFHAAYGDGPWVCEECDEIVEKLGRGQTHGCIHHRDENGTNDTPENLVVLHGACHSRLHGQGRSFSNETRARIGARIRGHPSKLRGRHLPAETRARISAAWRARTAPHPRLGQHQTAEVRAQISAKMSGRRLSAEHRARLRGSRIRLTCEDCGKEFARNWIIRHKTEGRCKTGNNV